MIVILLLQFLLPWYLVTFKIGIAPSVVPMLLSQIYCVLLLLSDDMIDCGNKKYMHVLLLSLNVYDISTVYCCTDITNQA